MVTIVDFAPRKNHEGEEFFALILQGGVEMVLSKTTAQYYLTAKRTSIPSTFDEVTCKSLVGERLSGSIQKVQCDPYELTLKDSGEVVELDHRWVYVKEGESLEEVIHEGAVMETVE